MNKTKLIIALFSMSLILFGCSNKKIEETKTITSKPKKEVVKKKTEQSSSESSTQETFNDVEAQPNDLIQESPGQQVSDMPPSWYGTQQEWEEAKTQGWTAEGYEEQVKASENESGPIQPGDSNYVWSNELDEQRNDFFNEFYSEHGREPSSGETQAAWIKEQGWE